mgnify:CR=1 FL=1
MILKKKAQEKSEIVWWVIALIGLGVLGVFAYRFYAETPALLDKEACKESVAKRALWGINNLPEGAKPELRCKTQNIIVKSTNENEVKKQIANSMYDCWDMLGQGKIDLFGVSYGEWGPEINKRCVVCSTVQFSSGTQKSVKRVNNLVAYMNKEEVPRKNVTYWQFLTNKEDIALDSSIEPISFLETKDKYAVLFVAVRKLSSAGDFATFYGAWVAAGAAIGFIIPNPITPVLGGVAGLIVAIGERIYYGAQEIEAACSGDVGCYSLLLVPYNAQAIAENCETLESLP